MSIENTTKINLLLQSQPKGIVFTSQWMAKNGYSPQLQRRYREYNWFESIGAGAMVRTGDQVSLEGAVYSLQRQLGLDVHIGRKIFTWIAWESPLPKYASKISLFAPLKENLPRWFLKYEGWKNKYTFTQTDFLPRDIGKLGMSYQGYEIRISSVARAIMECLYLAPKEQSLIECYEIMEGLNNLRPQVVQELLEKCNSVKVKRLFLYMADKAGHSWFKYLQVDKIDTGTGKRSIVEHGMYNAKYQIIIPKELEKMNAEYREQVKLLLDVMPYVAEEKQLALHGGTAINLFVRNMPRMSVDIDLTYIPVEDREITLSNIHDILLRLKKRIENNLVGSSVEAKPAIGKLLISNEKATIKLEINLVGRGVFDNTEKVALCNSAQEAYDTFVEINMVSLAQLFGGKICAALDRQHPRDLFDVKYLLETEGVSNEIKRGFMYCLLGSERPIYEVLNPHRLDQKEALFNQFDGMTDVLFTYEDYESTREKLINEIQASLTNSDIDFLVGFKSLKPDWAIYPYEQYPSIRWKLLNIQKLRDKNPEKYNGQVNRLKEFLDQIRP